MGLDDLDQMTAEEVRGVDLYALLYEEREWLARCALAAMQNSAYASTVETDDIANEIICSIAKPKTIMARQAEKPADSRARSLRAYCLQIIRTQWRRKFHAQYAAVGHADIADAESVITHDGPDRLRNCGVSVEQEAILQWEETNESRRMQTYLESFRDQFPAQQFKVLEMSIICGLGASESARMLNCSTNNVHGLLRKARRRLQEIYETTGSFRDDVKR